MISLTPIYIVAGVAIVSKFVEDFLTETGRGHWVWLAKLTMYAGVGIFAVNVWHEHVQKIGSVFGVFVP